MGLRTRVYLACLVFADDTLADLEGIFGEIGDQTESDWPTGGIWWVRRHRKRLRALLWRTAPPRSSMGCRRGSPPSPLGQARSRTGRRADVAGQPRPIVSEACQSKGRAVDIGQASLPVVGGDAVGCRPPQCWCLIPRPMR